jgi:hypothetical protein
MCVNNSILTRAEYAVELQKRVTVSQRIYLAHERRDYMDRNAARTRLLNQRPSGSADEFGIVAIRQQPLQRQKSVSLSAAERT